MGSLSPPIVVAGERQSKTKRLDLPGSHRRVVVVVVVVVVEQDGSNEVLDGSLVDWSSFGRGGYRGEGRIVVVVQEGRDLVREGGIQNHWSRLFSVGSFFLSALSSL